MKQRIRAEAHGKTPSCRHRPSTDADTEAEAGSGARVGTESSTETTMDADPDPVRDPSTPLLR
jgi:hypothetical protein